MGRKKPIPQQIGLEQRQQREWNMLDNCASHSGSSSGIGSLTVIEDSDPMLLQEKKAAKLKLREKKVASEGILLSSTSVVADESGSCLKSRECESSVPESTRAFFFKLTTSHEFKRLMKESVCIPMFRKDHPHSRQIENEWTWEVGTFSIQLREHCDLPVNPQNLLSFQECWLCLVQGNNGSHFIYYEVHDEMTEKESKAKMEEERKPSAKFGASMKRKPDINDRLGLFWYIRLKFQNAWNLFVKLSRCSQRKFFLKFREFDHSGTQFEVTMYGRKDSLMHFNHPSQIFIMRDENYMLHEVMHHFCNLGPLEKSYDKNQCNFHHDFQELYEGIKALQSLKRVKLDLDVQHPSLKPKLRPYQRDAVCWMLKQERYGQKDNGDETENELHLLYTEMTTVCGKTVYYNREGGSLVMEKPRRIVAPPGGILADEMGLGKTVEVLCCMLLHPRPIVSKPARLLTLTEMNLLSEQENSWEVSSSSTSSQKSRLCVNGTKLTVGCNNSDKDSDSSSLFRIPSEAVSYEFTPDHSYTINSSTKAEHQDIAFMDLPLASTGAYTSCSPEFTSVLRAQSMESVNAVVSSPSGDTLNTQIKQVLEKQNSSSLDAFLTFASQTNVELEKQSGMVIDAAGVNSKSRRKKHQLSNQGNSESKSAKKMKSAALESHQGKIQKFSQLQDENTDSEMQTIIVKKKPGNLIRCVRHIFEEEYQELLQPEPQIIPRMQLFECACGKGETDSKPDRQKHIVSCVECKTSQHAECMHYDLWDPFRGPYKCPHCHYHGKPIPSGATLIISPFSISHQWTDEIKKHVCEKSIKVFVYTGVSNQGFIQPQTLANQDIVITTYETLRKELNYVDLPHTNSDAGRRFRNPKKFMAKPTPLTAVEWWRICLDEAQMVESVTTKTAEMALRLSCVNRWCVTGTPLNHSVNDLFGLLAFIGFDPYCVEMWWKKLLYEPFLHGVKSPIYETLAKVMWRTSMKDVEEQLALKGQTDKLYHLTFSPVEDIFYQRLYNKCASEIRKSTLLLSSDVDRSTKLNKLSQSTFAKIWDNARISDFFIGDDSIMCLRSSKGICRQHSKNNFFRPLVKLRQACCHPQAVRGSFIPVQESMLTMEQLLDNLIKKTTTECRESHRNMTAALNGMAGIYLLEDKPRVVEAVEMYRSVLMSVEEHQRKKQFETDALPHLHAMHNLKLILDIKPPGIGSTLRDDQLGAQCDALREKYMLRVGSAVTAARNQLVPLQQAVQELTQQLASVGQNWYVAVLSHAYQSGHGTELVRKVQEDISDVSVHKSFRNVTGLQYVVETELSELQAKRSRLLVEMNKIDRLDPHEEGVLEKIVTCCLRTINGVVLKDCVFCKLSGAFEQLECNLFDLAIEERIMGGVSHSAYRKGTWKDGALELMLKAIQSFARNQHLKRDLIQAGSVHIRLFEAWKKEFKQLRALWVKLREEISAVDELEMAVTRMRLRLPGEQSPGEWDINIRDKTELEGLLKKFATDRKIYAAELRIKCGQLEYLKNLAKGSQGEFVEGVNPEQCPICKDQLGKNWSVLQCGHCFCMNCIQTLIDRSNVGIHTHANFSVKCAICREKMKANEISYVSTHRTPTDDFSPSVKGSHSSKVAAVVQCVLNIHRSDSQAKILVFATWVDVLKLIGNALEENDIQFTHLYDSGVKFERNVTSFKEDPHITVLLLPYHTGSNGLNLFEACHVILVEPTLNPSQEAQAIGRVYRMGQTRPTKIHRFLVKDTIEERIHHLMESTLRPAADGNETAKELMTIGQLISLFEDHEDNQAEGSEISSSMEDTQQDEALTGLRELAN